MEAGIRSADLLTMPLHRASRLAAGLSSLVLIFMVASPVYAVSPALCEPVVLEGRNLPEFAGLPVGELALYRLQGNDLLAVPFQVDRKRCERDGERTRCRYLVDGQSGEDQADQFALGTDDELVFLAREAGECDLSLAAGAAEDQGLLNPSERLLEVRIEAPHMQACVYLARRRAGTAGADFTREVTCDPDAHVLTAGTYRVEFDPANPYFWNRISLAAQDGWIPVLGREDILSRILHAGGLVLYTIDRSDFRSEVLGYRQGPVRTIRLTRNRVRCGPFLWKETLETGIYYGDRFQATFHTGTYLHWRFLVEERLNLYTGVSGEAAGMESLDTVKDRERLADPGVARAEEGKPSEGGQELVLAMKPGAVVYRLCTGIDRDPGRASAEAGDPEPGGRALLREVWIEEAGGSPARAGFCLPNLQDGKGPRQRFTKNLYFFLPEPSGRLRAPRTLGDAPLRVRVGNREIPGPVESSCWPGPRSESVDTEEALPKCLGPSEPPRLDRTWGFVPVISSGPDRGFGLGVKFRHPEILGPGHSLETRFLYTIYQYQIAEFWYGIESFPAKSHSLRLTCNYYNKPRARFYGIGNRSEESDGADFRWQDLDASVTIEQTLPRHFSLTAGWEARWGGIGDGKISEWPNLDDSFPNLFGLQGGWATGPALGIHHTTLWPRRDPLAGGRQSFTAAFFEDRFGGRYTFQRYRLEAVQIVPLPGWSHRLALRAQAQVLRGNPPFYQLSWAGGTDTARGYYEGRYRDQDRILLNAEYRCKLYKFLDGVLFLDAGRVMADLPRSPTLRGLHLTGGAGVRFHLYPDLVVRLDVGVSSEKAGVYFDFGHAF